MNIFKFVVSSRAKSIGLFPACVNAGFLCEFDMGSFGVVPVFNDGEPVLFKLSHARFISRELRRSGFCVTVFPYLLVVIKRLILKVKCRIEEKSKIKKKWRK